MPTPSHARGTFDRAHCIAAALALAFSFFALACSGTATGETPEPDGGTGDGSAGSSSGSGSSGSGSSSGASSGAGPAITCKSPSECTGGQICCGSKTTGTQCEAACMKGQRKVCQSSRTDCGPGEHCKMELGGYGLCEQSKVGLDAGRPPPADAASALEAGEDASDTGG